MASTYSAVLPLLFHRFPLLHLSVVSLTVVGGFNGFVLFSTRNCSFFPSFASPTLSITNPDLCVYGEGHKQESTSLSQLIPFCLLCGNSRT